MQKTLDRLACAGLVIGAVCGVLGTILVNPPVRALLWTTDGVAIVMATAF